jgi:putative hemin transport protein
MLNPTVLDQVAVNQGMSHSKVNHELKQRWQEHKNAHPRMRIRDAAKILEVSELELLVTGCGDSVVRLKPDWPDILKSLQSLGPVMALTRNEYAVHEKNGVYNKVRIMGSMGLVLDKAIDLRLFLSHWHHGFSVCENTASGERQSLQFFDLYGTAIHKIYLLESSNKKPFDKLLSTYTSRDQSTFVNVSAMPKKSEECDDSSVDVSAFRSSWDAMKDTHDFHEVQKSYGLSRIQALRLGGSDRARMVSKDLFTDFMTSLVEGDISFMIFVGNKGIIQIHSGPVSNIKTFGSWFNILDDDFNLHLRTDAIDTAWAVRKPTVDGDVNSLELFDANGDVIAYFFGSRKPGQPELANWRKIVNALPTLDADE